MEDARVVRSLATSTLCCYRYAEGDGQTDAGRQMQPEAATDRASRTACIRRCWGRPQALPWCDVIIGAKGKATKSLHGVVLNHPHAAFKVTRSCAVQ